MATATRTDKLRAAHERLQEAVESIVSGEDWERMLRTAAKFHRYSFNNQVHPPSKGPRCAQHAFSGGEEP